MNQRLSSISFWTESNRNRMTLALSIKTHRPILCVPESGTLCTYLDNFVSFISKRTGDPGPRPKKLKL